MKKKETRSVRSTERWIRRVERTHVGSRSVPRKLNGRQHVSWLLPKVHRRHRRSVEPTKLKSVQSKNVVDRDGPAGIEDLCWGNSENERCKGQLGKPKGVGDDDERGKGEKERTV